MKRSVIQIVIIISILVLVFSGCAKLENEKRNIAQEESNIKNFQGGAKENDSIKKYLNYVRSRVSAYWWNYNEKGDYSAVVSFNISDHGLVDLPIIEKSSGEDRLNSLIIQAIDRSAPFKQFPAEISESSLHVKIHFKYVKEREKSQTQ